MKLIKSLLLLSIIAIVALSVTAKRHKHKSKPSYREKVDESASKELSSSSSSESQSASEEDESGFGDEFGGNVGEGGSSQDEIEAAIADAAEIHASLRDHLDMSLFDVTQQEDNMMQSIMGAIQVEKVQPSAQAVQSDIIKQQVDDAHEALSQHLIEASKHHKEIASNGNLSADEVIEHQTALQQNLELALKHAQLHAVAVQQVKAIAAGATNAEVAQIAAIVPNGI